MSEIEMEDLSNKQSGDDSTTAIGDATSKAMRGLEDALSVWAYAAAFLLSIPGILLVFLPRLLLFISEGYGDRESRAVLTPVESFLARHFGILLLATSLSLLMNEPSSSPVPRRDETPSHPLLITLTSSSLLSSFLSWNTRDIGPLATVFAAVYGSVGLWGLWAVVFGASASYSKRTGADKHTSSFIFGNRASASKRKKAWRAEQKDKNN